MNALSELRSESVRALFWRDEIPEAMYWLRNEGLGEEVDPELLDRFIWTDVKVDANCLDSLVAHGLLQRTPAGRYELTEAGLNHGARLFEDDFSEFDEAAAPGIAACACCRDLSEPEPAPADSAWACGCCTIEPEPEADPVAVASCGCCR